MDTGGKIRTGMLLEKLKENFDITLVSNVESPKDEVYLGQMKNLCSEFHAVPWQEVKKYSLRFYLRVLTRMFSCYPVTVINDYSRDLERKIQDVLKKGRYDLLICDFLQPALNFKNVTGHAMLLFQHNVESVIIRRHYEIARNPLLKLFWWMQWRKMCRFEREACRWFDGIVTVSEADKNHLIERFGARNVFAIPTGVDTTYFSPRNDQAMDNTLVFTGAMDWLPNEDAILYFAQDILGKIKRQVSSVKLIVVGRNPSRSLLSKLKDYPEIETVGRVEDVRPYIAQSAVYVIPLRIGGGTRIKAYEAMAMGKAVVSTRVGIEGLPVEDRKHLVIADGADDFARSVVKLLQSPQLREEIGSAAREYIQKNFSWGKAAEEFAQACWSVVETKSPIEV